MRIIKHILNKPKKFSTSSIEWSGLDHLDIGDHQMTLVQRLRDQIAESMLLQKAVFELNDTVGTRTEDLQRMLGSSYIDGSPTLCNACENAVKMLKNQQADLESNYLAILEPAVGEISAKALLENDKSTIDSAIQDVPWQSVQNSTSVNR